MTKLVKSACEKAWLFDVKKEDDMVRAGFACFLSSCPSQLTISLGKEKLELMTPAQAMNSPMPVRIINARLSVL
jgi:hypothetical protein